MKTKQLRGVYGLMLLNTETDAQRLCRVAPKLLAALKEVAEELRRDEYPESLDLGYILRVAEAAIAEAEGKQP